MIHGSTGLVTPGVPFFVRPMGLIFRGGCPQDLHDGQMR